MCARGATTVPKFAACILFDGCGHRIDVLSTASAMFGLITIALAIYHWHLGSRRSGLASRPRRALARERPAARARAERSQTATGPAPRSIRRSGIFPRAVLHARAEAEQTEGEPRQARRAAEPSRRHAGPAGLEQRGVYTTSEVQAGRPEQRGQDTAERVLSDALGARTRRGRNAALDVIVVGASREGIAATLRLMRAGLRVLLVDAGCGEGPHAARLLRDSSVNAALRALRRERLPIVWGHRVLGVGRRPDGMLELSAERAAWYTANVIVALPGDSQHEHAA
jgi:hypothetical protein